MSGGVIQRRAVGAASLMCGMMLVAAPLHPQLQRQVERSPEQLCEAAATNDRDLLASYYEAGGALNVVCDAEEETRLIHRAAFNNSVEVVQFMVENSIALAARDNQGRNALHYAAAQGHTEAIDALVAGGVNPDRGDVVGDTPLHYVVRSGNIEALRVLLERGAPDVRALNERGASALDVALARGHRAMADLLREAGAQESQNIEVHDAVQEEQSSLSPRTPQQEEDNEALLVIGAVVAAVGIALLAGGALIYVSDSVNLSSDRRTDELIGGSIAAAGALILVSVFFVL